MANSHRRNNYLGNLEVDGEVYEDEAKVVAQVVVFYQKLYKETETWRLMVDDLNLYTIGEVENEEILQVVRDMEGDKVAGPDGFTMTFFHHCWRVVESDILSFFDEFYDYNKVEKSLNALFIALIPKKHKAFNIRDFRPISLLSSVYKMLAKVLAY